MYLIVSFDIPRTTKSLRKQATLFRSKLVDLGFEMNQYSLYIREVRNLSTKNNILILLQEEIPEEGLITVYALPDDVYNNQITILGEKVKVEMSKGGRLIKI